MIVTFDKQNLAIVRARMDEALKGLAEIGVSATASRITYSGKTATVKVEIAIINEDGTVASKAAQDYRLYQEMRDLPDLGTTFRSGGRTYRISGFAPRSTRFPVLAERDDGKTFKFPVSTVQRCVATNVGS